MLFRYVRIFKAYLKTKDQGPYLVSPQQFLSSRPMLASTESLGMIDLLKCYVLLENEQYMYLLQLHGDSEMLLDAENTKLLLTVKDVLIKEHLHAEFHTNVR